MSIPRQRVARGHKHFRTVEALIIRKEIDIVGFIREAYLAESVLQNKNSPTRGAKELP